MSSPLKYFRWLSNTYPKKGGEGREGGTLWKKNYFFPPDLFLTHSFSQVSSELAWAADRKELASTQGLLPAQNFCMHMKSDDPDVSTHRFSVIPKIAQLDPIFNSFK